MTDHAAKNDSRESVTQRVGDWNFVIAQVASAFASRESSTVQEILSLVDGLSNALATAQEGDKAHPQKNMGVRPIGAAPHVPAVPIEDAVQDEYVTCLCCGERFTMLKRHLKAEHGLTVDEYRRRFQLPDDMPLVAPSYSKRKAEFARDAGLGKHDRTV